MNTFFSTFKDFANNKSQEIRYNFVYNLPAVIKIFGSKFFDLIKLNFVYLLLSDSNIEIKILCIKIYPEIIKLFGVEESFKVITEPFREVLFDLNEEEELIIIGLKTLPEIIETLFSKKNCEENENQRFFFIDIMEKLITLIKKNENSAKWRKQFLLFQIFSNTK